ncbi:MAG: thioredoxin family protein [Bacteroidota bacterium]|jgi:thioredoxin-related protein|nr:thioredoxin family protein [Bacteroidota bacterium]
MKNLSIMILCFTGMSFTGWQPNFETAKKVASEKHELILLNFSGSDWCGPCMRLRKEIFESDVFSKMADTSLVLLDADFPRNKKNQLDEKTMKQNDALADRYNPDGNFPFTLLLDANGKVIKSWIGLPTESAEEFTDEIASICNYKRNGGQITY